MYLSFDFIIYKITREMDTLNDNMKIWWSNMFANKNVDQGYTLIESDKNDRYVAYDDLWDFYD